MESSKNGSPSSLNSTFCSSISPATWFYSPPPQPIAMDIMPLCPYCPQRCSQNNFEVHLRWHKFKIMSCNECFKFFDTEKMVEHFKCFCKEGIRADYKKNKRHLETGFPPLPVWNCPVCDCDFCGETQDQVGKHYEWRHRKTNCKTCGQELAGLLGIRLHSCSGHLAARLPGPGLPVARFGYGSVSTQQTSNPRMVPSLFTLRKTIMPRPPLLGTPLAIGSTTVQRPPNPVETVVNGPILDNAGHKPPYVPNRKSFDQSAAMKALPQIPRLQQTTGNAGLKEPTTSVSKSSPAKRFNLSPVSSPSSSSSSESDDENWSTLKRKLNPDKYLKKISSLPTTSAPSLATATTGIQARKRNDPPKIPNPAPSGPVKKAVSTSDGQSQLLPKPISKDEEPKVKIKAKVEGKRPEARDLATHKYVCRRCGLKSIYKHSIKHHINGVHQVPLKNWEQYFEYRANDEEAGKDEAGQSTSAIQTDNDAAIQKRWLEDDDEEKSGSKKTNGKKHK